MLKKAFVVLFLITSVLIPGYNVYGERIIFTNGDSLDVDIISQNDTVVVVRLSTGIISFNKNTIKSILPSVDVSVKDQKGISPNNEQPMLPETIGITVKSASTTPSQQYQASNQKFAQMASEIDAENVSYLKFFPTKEAFLDFVNTLHDDINKNPNDIDTHYKLGIAYYYLKEYLRSLEELTLVMREGEKNIPETYLFLGYIYFHTGDSTTAIQNLEMYLTKRPLHTAARILLASLYYDTNDIKNATREYKKLLEQNPNNLLIQKRLKSINSSQSKKQ
jgi:tetratricopeptide (TPR) repeat protein